MTSTQYAVPAANIDEQRAFLSEVFHDLSQPLTALHCALDLALHRDRTSEQLRASIQEALQNASRLRQRLMLLRTLSEASDPGDLSTPADITTLLRELCADMLPLFESAGRRLECEIAEGEPILVRGNKGKLSRALFTLLEYLFLYSPEGAVFCIRLHRNQDGQAEIEIAGTSALPLTPSSNGTEAPTPYSCEIEMARRSFRAAGGELLAIPTRPECSQWRATLPLM